jgi:RND family efflux transporter MFP subunit
MESIVPDPVEKPTDRNLAEPLSPAAEANNGGPAASAKKRFLARPSRLLFWIPGLVIVGGALTFFAVRAFTKTSEVKDSSPAAVPVSVASVTRADVYNEVTIPAEFRPYVEVELHAKVSGYLTNISVDFGDRVKAGQLLAQLEVPELKDELDRAIAARQKAEADHTDANLAYSRLLKVEQEHTNLVAQQEVDTAGAKDRSTDATIAGAKADVEKYLTMVAYTRITAPFDGVVTRRYADPGALIQAGTASDTQSLPLVRISDNYHLRLDFPVSVLYVKEIKLGDPVEVRVDSFGGKSFTGTISRFTHKVEEDTRTMITEIEVPNPNLELVPGMYANVVLKVGRHAQALTVPTEAITADRKPSVYVVNDHDVVEERPVELGLETPTRYEVLSGLKDGELVVTAGRSQLKPGQKVIAKQTGSLAQQ